MLMKNASNSTLKHYHLNKKKAKFVLTVKLKAKSLCCPGSIAALAEPEVY